jgi:hypothetical protein
MNRWTSDNCNNKCAKRRNLMQRYSETIVSETATATYATDKTTLTSVKATLRSFLLLQLFDDEDDTDQRTRLSATSNCRYYIQCSTKMLVPSIQRHIRNKPDFRPQRV